MRTTNGLTFKRWRMGPITGRPIARRIALTTGRFRFAIVGNGPRQVGATKRFARGCLASRPQAVARRSRRAGGDRAVTWGNVLTHEMVKERRPRFRRPRDRGARLTAGARAIRHNHLRPGHEAFHERVHLAPRRKRTQCWNQQHRRAAAGLVYTRRKRASQPRPTKLARAYLRRVHHDTASIQNTKRDWPTNLPELSGGERCNTRGPGPGKADPLKMATSIVVMRRILPPGSTRTGIRTE